jgi:uncharacterized protein (TIGR00725 family)
MTNNDKNNSYRSSRKPRIGLIGPGKNDPEANRLAEEVGRLVAKAGAILICGGLGGAMEAAARGAKKAGGITVGILPHSVPDAANPYIDIPIVTGMGHARNVINVLTSQAVIAVRGEMGTLSEIALALKQGVPVVGLQTWRLETLGVPIDGVFIQVSSAEEASAKALELARHNESGGRC